MKAIVAAVVVAVAFGTWTPSARSQGVEAEELSADALRREIQFLGVMHQLGVTAEQRMKAAQAIEAFEQQAEALRKRSEPPELLSALKQVRDALVRGQEPTDQMRAALEAAQPPDDGSLDKAFDEARGQVLKELTGILTEDQQTQLQLIALFGAAQDVIGMCLRSREVSAEEGQDMRLHGLAELRADLKQAAGPEADRVLADFQSLINRVSAMTPEQVAQQREQLAGQIVTFLKDTLDKNPQMAADRLQDQLWEFVTDPQTARLLRESAKAMGAQ